MLGRTDSRARALLVLIGFVLVAGSLGVRLAYWQVGRRDELAAKAVRQSSMRYEIPSMRGSIYDRTGTVVLATSVDRDRLAAYPKLLTPERRAAVASRLVTILGLEGDAAAELTTRMASDARVRGARARPRPGHLRADPRPRAPATTPRSRRSCWSPSPSASTRSRAAGPNTTLAAHLLGFVNRDGAGQYGIEQHYQDQLAGMPRVVAAQKDAAGNPVPDSSPSSTPATPGRT